MAEVISGKLSFVNRNYDENLTLAICLDPIPTNYNLQCTLDASEHSELSKKHQLEVIEESSMEREDK